MKLKDEMSGTLYLRGMPRRLVREAKVAAAQQGMTLGQLVSQALAQTLGSETLSRMPLPGSLEEDARWYEANKPELLQRYEGQYVAVMDGSVVDHDAEFSSLAERVHDRYGARAILMPRCQAAERIFHLRSPRLRRR